MWVPVEHVIFLCGCVVYAFGHVHHQPLNDNEQLNKLRDPKLVQDPEHIKEHLKEDLGDIDESKMSPEELEFHYFKMHDLDNNTKLDGLEILAALTHAMPMDDVLSTEQKEKQMKLYTDIIDKVFEDDDFNDDGFLSYVEYVLARRRDEMSEKKEHDPGQL